MFESPVELRCEHLVNPIFIDIRNPRFSWIMNHQERNQFQSAYKIIVSSEETLSGKYIGEFWESGKVDSELNVNIEYNGSRLESDKDYF